MPSNGIKGEDSILGFGVVNGTSVETEKLEESERSFGRRTVREEKMASLVVLF